MYFSSPIFSLSNGENRTFLSCSNQKLLNPQKGAFYFETESRLDPHGFDSQKFSTINLHAIVDDSAHIVSTSRPSYPRFSSDI